MARAGPPGRGASSGPGGFGVCVALAVNDLLHAAGVIQSVRLFDYAFVGVAVGLHYLVVARLTGSPPTCRAR